MPCSLYVEAAYIEAAEEPIQAYYCRAYYLVSSTGAVPFSRGGGGQCILRLGGGFWGGGR